MDLERPTKRAKIGHEPIQELGVPLDSIVHTNRLLKTKQCCSCTLSNKFSTEAEVEKHMGDAQDEGASFHCPGCGGVACIFEDMQDYLEDQSSLQQCRQYRDLNEEDLRMECAKLREEPHPGTTIEVPWTREDSLQWLDKRRTQARSRVEKSRPAGLVPAPGGNDYPSVADDDVKIPPASPLLPKLPLHIMPTEDSHYCDTLCNLRRFILKRVARTLHHGEWASTYHAIERQRQGLQENDVLDSSLDRNDHNGDAITDNWKGFAVGTVYSCCLMRRVNTNMNGPWTMAHFG